MYADLHLHTTASDGLLTPAAVVKNAAQAGFSAIAITDHDTTSGLKEALTAGAKHQLEVIPGIELSTLDGDREIHILGYYVDSHHPGLQQMLTQMIEARQNRAAKMVEKLQRLGYVIELNRVREIAGSAFIGRPHIARALLEKGYISEPGEAFTETFIGRGGRAYVERFKLSPAEAIKILIQAGAIPVLAHPGFLSKGEPVSEAEIAALVKAGLRGIEVYYSRHSAAQTEHYTAIAKRYNLLITGGSDCHGIKDAPNCLGSVKLPYEYAQTLQDAIVRP